MVSARPRTAPAAVGVLALQGGVAEHLRLIEGLGARAVPVRRERDLTGPDGPRVDAIVLPGGESSTQDRLLRLLDLAEPLRGAVADGVPALGTCAGLILLAREVLDPAPGQRSLDLLDVSVRRNAFGAQLVSHEAEFEVGPSGIDGTEPGGTVRGALIRAPEIVSVGSGARAIVRRDGRVLGATSIEGDADVAGHASLGRVTGIAFHPELSGEPAIHRALLSRIPR
ncbi:pyridoxal 5'-phosphate synthase glutaminase subunit PdxT [Leucobacter weissii]|uniref:glutaminase n=1 Tax=Leucobacter weissii TaxID=1983706 RepID=A0A939MIX8_9MICO|nr:pyridoxal 5'-phosphate synthase glutaminase subunit PdxT [Leucobacter weissii]MBO1900855.1 pyridoxal 5'-phosphate synthase glutaminase subunit PdxT [Leucobacter weissii]